MANQIADYEELERRLVEVATLGSCSAALGWDERTFLPARGSAHRARQISLLARIAHEGFTHPRIGELLGRLEGASLGPPRDANVREWRRAYRRANLLPPAFVEELAQVTSQAQSVWQRAKEANDFPAFLPWLKKIVRLKREEADRVGYARSPYDALVDEFEPGATADELAGVLSELVKELAPLVAEITERSRSRAADPGWSGDFPVAGQAEFCRELAEAVGFDFERGRLDATSHPFCTGLGPDDCRILTRYHPGRPYEAIYGTLHEAGHGLYEQGLPADAWGTPGGSAASFGIHESQSRLWENQIGRSRPFWQRWGPRFRDRFPSAAGLSDDRLWQAANVVCPSLIRVDADEVTYNLHIVMRFELELALLVGELPPDDLPAAWSEKSLRYLGLTVPDDARGCLQDIHWSFGGIGYFPTYALGNLYSAQFMEAAEREIPGLWESVRSGDMSDLARWLRRKIHVHGQQFRPNELCVRVSGRPLDPHPFLRYLREKFLADPE
jgi:carboxypeptidase Taq